MIMKCTHLQQQQNLHISHCIFDHLQIRKTTKMTYSNVQYMDNKKLDIPGTFILGRTMLSPYK